MQCQDDLCLCVSRCCNGSHLLLFFCLWCTEPLPVSEGWLQYETMVQIQIHPTKHQPISMQRQGPIKLCFQQQQRDSSGSLLDVQPMHVKVWGWGGGAEGYNTQTISLMYSCAELSEHTRDISHCSLYVYATQGTLQGTLM